MDPTRDLESELPATAARQTDPFRIDLNDRDWHRKWIEGLQEQARTGIIDQDDEAHLILFKTNQLAELVRSSFNRSSTLDASAWERADLKIHLDPTLENGSLLFDEISDHEAFFKSIMRLRPPKRSPLMKVWIAIASIAARSWRPRPLWSNKAIALEVDVEPTVVSHSQAFQAFDEHGC